MICEYLDDIGDAPRLFPREAGPRLTALRRQALGDGFMDILVLWRNERDRPEQHRSPPHMAAFETKYRWTMAALERESEKLRREPFSIGHISLGCALGYLDFRFSNLKWRETTPALAAWHADVFANRPSYKATEVVDNS